MDKSFDAELLSESEHQVLHWDQVRVLLVSKTATNRLHLGCLCLLMAEQLEYLELLFCDNVLAKFAILVILFHIVPVDMGHEVKSVEELADEEHEWAKHKEQRQVEQNLTS